MLFGSWSWILAPFLVALFWLCAYVPAETKNLAKMNAYSLLPTSIHTDIYLNMCAIETCRFDIQTCTRLNLSRMYGRKFEWDWDGLKKQYNTEQNKTKQSKAKRRQWQTYTKRKSGKKRWIEIKGWRRKKAAHTHILQYWVLTHDKRRQ